jgi:hypothetical protein
MIALTIPPAFHFGEMGRETKEKHQNCCFFSFQFLRCGMKRYRNFRYRKWMTPVADGHFLVSMNALAVYQMLRKTRSLMTV